MSQGAAACIAYLKRKYTDDVTWRQRVIITSVQNCLSQGWERGITDSSMFEPDTVLNNGPDHWFAVQLSYFWQELVPELRKIWGVEGRKNKQMKNSIWINNFPFNEKEVVWAFSNFSDAYGMMMSRQRACFRRCACTDDKGRRKPCVPPKKGFMCERYATLIKAHFVMEGQKKERLWMALKKKGIEESEKKAEAEALKYLHSAVGKLWLETEAYKRAEATLNEMGGERQEQWREKAVNNAKAAIILYYEGKMKRVKRIRDEKAAAMQEELDQVREDWKKAKAGYMKTTLEQQMEELIKKLANMDENVHLQRLAKQMDRRCADVVDAVHEADDTDSSDSDAEMPDSDDESEIAQLRRERYVRRLEEELDEERIRKRRTPLQPIPPTPLEMLQREVELKVMPVVSVILPHNRKREKQRAALLKAAKKRLINVVDIVDIRVRKLFAKMGGIFDEIQKEA